MKFPRTKSHGEKSVGIQRAGRLLCALLLVTFGGVLTGGTVRAEDTSGSDPLKGVSFEAVGYVDYSNGQTAGAQGTQSDYNRFQVTRGYFTFKKNVSDWMSVRVTMDIHQDESGDYKRREKYYYAELRPNDIGFLTHMQSEIGMGHMPWLDFEEHINPYRSQGTMAIERAGVFNSADAGVSLRGYLGEPMPDAAKKTGNKKYAGRYGSWHVGVYNGGGYHAKEMNENKVVEGRLTLRPLADHAPGLQLSYLGIYGKGNVEPTTATLAASDETNTLPDYIVHLGMLSYEHPSIVLTGQAFITEGNAKGKWVLPGSNDGLVTMGMSAFGNLKIPGTESRLNVFGRYDRFDADHDDIISDESTYQMYVGGIAFSVHKSNLLMLVFESTDYDADFGAGKGSVPEIGTNLGRDEKVQVVYQIKI